MFSKDKVKRLRQVNYILEHNVKLTDKGRKTLEKMRNDLMNEGIDPNAEVKKVKKKRVNTYGVKKGDVFIATSGGKYSTYHDFYEVTEIVGKKRVKVKELKKVAGKRPGKNDKAWTVRPVKNQYVSDEEYVRNVLTFSKDDKPKKIDTHIWDKNAENQAFYNENPFNRDWDEDPYH